MFTRTSASSSRHVAGPALLVCALALAGCSSLGEDDPGLVAQTSTTVPAPAATVPEEPEPEPEPETTTTTTVEETDEVAVADPDEIDEGDVNGDGEVTAGERENLPVTGPNDVLLATIFGLLLLLGGRTVLDAESAIRRRLARRHAIMPPR